MGKIKVNLASGSSVEKPLVTCFKGTNGDYLILDNETNGSMGLPIICISKFTGSGAEKIIDQAEWGSVKENLKTIIGGTALPYLNVPESITAQDDFFTQLTLPVASFDLLKNAYAPQTEALDEPAAPATPEAQPAVAPAVEPAPAVESAPVAEPAVVMPDLVAPEETIGVPLTQPAVTPSVPTEPVVAPAPAVEPAPAAPTVDVAPSVNSADPEIAAIKENFMQSCETMFDSLIKKFNK